MTVDPYKALGIDRNATPEEIKNAYRRLAKKYHPDITGSKDDTKFKEIAYAYSILSNKQIKSSYNKSPHDFNSANFDFDSFMANLDPKDIANAVESLSALAKAFGVFRK